MNLTSRSRAVNNSLHSSYSCVCVDAYCIVHLHARLVTDCFAPNTAPAQYKCPTFAPPPTLPALPVLGYSAPVGAPAPRLTLDDIGMAVVPCNSGHASSIQATAMQARARRVWISSGSVCTASGRAVLHEE